MIACMIFCVLAVIVGVVLGVARVLFRCAPCTMDEDRAVLRALHDRLAAQRAQRREEWPS